LAVTASFVAGKGMMMKRLAFAAGLALAACSQQPANETASADTMTPVANDASPSPTAAASPTPVSSSSPDSGEPGKLPPPGGATPRYVGRWAASEQLCAAGAWRFYATHLETAGEVSCTYNRVDTVPGGYDLHATCTAEAPPAPDLIKLRFAESAQAMLVDSKTFKSTGLVYCGPLQG
jgi:hypothetical protein